MAVPNDSLDASGIRSFLIDNLREQAVKAYTYGSSFAEFAENEEGTIAGGKLADLVVLSQDIFAVPVPELPKTSSVLTIVGGKIVYDAKVLK